MPSSSWLTVGLGGLGYPVTGSLLFLTITANNAKYNISDIVGNPDTLARGIGKPMIMFGKAPLPGLLSPIPGRRGS